MFFSFLILFQQRICFYTEAGTLRGPSLSLECRHVCVHSMPTLDLTTLLFRFTLSVSWEMGFIIWNWSALRFILLHIQNICYIFIIWKKIIYIKHFKMQITIFYEDEYSKQRTNSSKIFWEKNPTIFTKTDHKNPTTYVYMY